MVMEGKELNIVEKVAADIADIPGKPSPHEIARVAIEAYQEAIWSPTFDRFDRGMQLELRRIRAHQLTANIMNIVGKYICQHDDIDCAREVTRDLFEALYEAGAEVITDVDRQRVGLLPRNPYGMTAEEVRIMEFKHLEAMLRPIKPMFIQTNVSHMSDG